MATLALRDNPGSRRIFFVLTPRARCFLGSPLTLNPGWGAPESLTGGAGAGAPEEAAAFFGAEGKGFRDVLKKARGPGFCPGDPWLSSSKTSRRNANITFFPFATGQRGGSRDTALRTRWV